MALTEDLAPRHDRYAPRPLIRIAQIEDQLGEGALGIVALGGSDGTYSTEDIYVS